MIRTAIALAVLGAGLVPGATPPPATPCSGVQVLVDPGSSPATTKCATKFDTGSVALASAGYRVATKDQMICQIDLVPDKCRISVTAYWSYWHAPRLADGAYGPWTYSNLGAASYHPNPGDAEGWSFGTGQDDPPAPLPGQRGASATPSSEGTPSARRSPAGEPASNDPIAPGLGGPTGLLVGLAVIACGAAALIGWRTRKGRSR